MTLRRGITLAAIWLAIAVAGYFLAAGVSKPPLVNINDVDIALPDLDNTPRRLAEWAGQPMMVNVWGTWCAPCRREIPLLKALKDEYQEQGLMVVGIAIDDMAAATDYATDTPFNYPILVGEEDGVALASALGVTTMAVPVTAFVDRAGHVRRIHLGEIHREEAELALKEILTH